MAKAMDGRMPSQHWEANQKGFDSDLAAELLLAGPFGSLEAP